MKSPTQCLYCGAELPAPHVGRGKQKQFCGDNCRVKLGYRRKYGVTTNRQRLERLKPYVGALSLEETGKAWLAAFIDGEGWIGIVKHQKKTGTKRWYYKPALAVANTNPALIQHVVALLGAERTRLQHRQIRKRRCKAVSWVFVERLYVSDVLRAIMPYLIAKRQQGEIVIQFCDTHDALPVRTSPLDAFETMHAELRVLNKRGVEE